MRTREEILDAIAETYVRQVQLERELAAAIQALEDVQSERVRLWAERDALDS